VDFCETARLVENDSEKHLTLLESGFVDGADFSESIALHPKSRSRVELHALADKHVNILKVEPIRGLLNPSERG
jgi:hypothetical protein